MKEVYYEWTIEKGFWQIFFSFFFIVSFIMSYLTKDNFFYFITIIQMIIVILLGKFVRHEKRKLNLKEGGKE